MLALLILATQLVPHLFPVSAALSALSGELAFSLAFASSIVGLLFGSPALQRSGGSSSGRLSAGSA
jgi:hypothetical protein